MLRQVLLVPDAPIKSHDYVEACVNCAADQFAVREACESRVCDGDDVVPWQELANANRKHLVEPGPSTAGCLRGKLQLGHLEDRDRLCAIHRWKLIEELAEALPPLEILEEGFHWDSSPSDDNRAPRDILALSYKGIHPATSVTTILDREREPATRITTPTRPSSAKKARNRAASIAGRTVKLGGA